jgi:hypothetical protein
MTAFDRSDVSGLHGYHHRVGRDGFVLNASWLAIAGALGVLVEAIAR